MAAVAGVPGLAESEAVREAAARAAAARAAAARAAAKAVEAMVVVAMAVVMEVAATAAVKEVAVRLASRRRHTEAGYELSAAQAAVAAPQWTSSLSLSLSQPRLSQPLLVLGPRQRT